MDQLHSSSSSSPSLSSTSSSSSSSMMTRRADLHAKTLIAMVGLPARGKSFLSAKLVTFFNWTGVPSKIFNAGERRRDAEGASESGRSSFFSSSNASAVLKRDEIALRTLAEAIDFLKNGGGTIAIFDATNTTKDRRRLLRENLSMKCVGFEINLIFIESICNDENILQNNFLQKVRNSPDFGGISQEEALKDLRKRISEYDAVYQTLEDEEGFPYIKLIDLASKVVCNRIWGAIPMKCVQLLMSCHVGQRPVYLVRAGHCDDVDDLSRGKWISENTSSNISRSSNEVTKDSGQELEISPNAGQVAWAGSGRDSSNDGEIEGAGGKRSMSIDGALGPYAKYFKGSDALNQHQHVISGSYIQDLTVKMPSSITSNARLSALGKKFSQRLAKFIQNEGHGRAMTIMSSTMPRALETALALGVDMNEIQQSSALGILDTGIFHGMSVQYIKDNYTEEYESWKADPVRYRFPGGESILDMTKRLVEIILEVEHNRNPVMVVSHLSTLQSISAYFTGKDPSMIPFISIPQHSVIILTPSIYGWSLKTVHESELPKDI